MGPARGSRCNRLRITCPYSFVSYPSNTTMYDLLWMTLLSHTCSKYFPLAVIHLIPSDVFFNLPDTSKIMFCDLVQFLLQCCLYHLFTGLFNFSWEKSQGPNPDIIIFCQILMYKQQCVNRDCTALWKNLLLHHANTFEHTSYTKIILLSCESLLIDHYVSPYCVTVIAN